MVDEYIRLMDAASKTPQHEVIEECLIYYGLIGTRELTLEQADEFIESEARKLKTQQIFCD